ncbi:helix-turn-helix domain-containing protein [uncultured Shimia sp.]|uniref:helix-turn-helix transcriptional regulator n=1 Tax=uncultured Shimia sp. TaxID=573152 RepID=UPI00261ED368|nr:helix-turn-helix domain-containing protein [uncultured Shimia sp.]
MSTKVYSIDEFCEAYGVSRSSFYRLRKAGTGPRVARLGGRVVVPVIAAQVWLATFTEAAN